MEDAGATSLRRVELCTKARQESTHTLAKVVTKAIQDSGNNFAIGNIFVVTMVIASNPVLKCCSERL
jgi:hypothetical protein